MRKFVYVSEMLIVRHLSTPNSDFNGCHCMRDPVLYRSMISTHVKNRAGGRDCTQPKTPQTCCKLSILPACCNLSTSCNKLVNFVICRLVTTNLVPRARDPLGGGTKDSGIIHLIIASDWLGRNVAR